MEMKEKNMLIGLGILILIGLLSLSALFGFYFGRQPQVLTQQVAAATPAVGPAVSPTPSPSPATVAEASPTAVPAPGPDEKEEIKEAVLRLAELNQNQAEVTITYQNEKHAKGLIKEFDAVGGAYWLAAKTTEGWVGVYAGQSQPKCEALDPYDFPTPLAPDCLNTSGTVVER